MGMENQRESAFAWPVIGMWLRFQLLKRNVSGRYNVYDNKLIEEKRLASRVIGLEGDIELDAKRCVILVTELTQFRLGRRPRADHIGERASKSESQWTDLQRGQYRRRALTE